MKQKREARRAGWARPIIAMFSLAALLSGCAAPRVPVATNAPMTARPQSYDPMAATPTGAIFQSNSNIFLFEDRKPRIVGDLMTVQINENLNASQSANSSAEKKTISLKLKDTFELPAGAAETYLARSPWREDAAKAELKIDAKQPHEFTLAPFEVLTLEMKPR